MNVHLLNISPRKRNLKIQHYTAKILKVHKKYPNKAQESLEEIGLTNYKKTRQQTGLE